MANDLKSRVSALKERLAKSEGGGSVGNFVGHVMHSGVAAHIMHLKTRSYAAHMALGAYYEGLPALIDAFAEAYQGRYGLIDSYPTTLSLPLSEPAEYMRSVKQMVEMERMSLPQDSELQNIVDEIASLIDGTLYKLTFLS